MEERTTESTRAFDGKLISVRVDQVVMANGHAARREVVEHPGAVAILAWDGARLTMVTQWRHATGRAMLEIPAGTLEAGESPRATAERELGEECGLAAGSWDEGPSFFTAPGFCTERLTLFLATDLRATHASAPDDELLEPSWLSLSDAVAAVDDGRVIDAKSVAGILWLAHRLAAGEEPA
jgi:ADP-ribose pyrophosphatase